MQKHSVAAARLFVSAWRRCQHLSIFVCNWLTHIRRLPHLSIKSMCSSHYTVHSINFCSIYIQLPPVWLGGLRDCNKCIYLLLFYLLAERFSFIYIYQYYYWSDFLSCKVLFNLFAFVGCKIFIYLQFITIIIVIVFIFYNVSVFFIGCMIFSHLLYYYHLS